MAPINHPPLTPATFEQVAKKKPVDDWLLAGRLSIMKHAQHGGYPSPEVIEDTTSSGLRRLSFYDGGGQRLMIVEKAPAQAA